jgi:hypothetical protein
MATDSYDYASISEIKAANASIGAHFFEPATMRFFNSKIASRTVYGGHYFITSERFEGSHSGSYDAPRLYTLRACYNGAIDTVGDFQQYKTLEEAKAAAKALAKFQRTYP